MKDFVNNRASMVGEIVSNFKFSHELFGERFYKFDISVKRLSGTNDVIPILVSERIFDVKENQSGRIVKVIGTFRSYNLHEENRNHLLLYVFANEIGFIDENEDRNINRILLDGYICKKPVYRITPLGREITDFLLAVNRAYGKSDYIPCICWNRNARFAERLEVGDRIQISGRIQSREYEKDDVKHTVYEVSVQTMEYSMDDDLKKEEI